MPPLIPALYFPGSKKLVMALDHQHRFLTSDDQSLKTDIRHMVFVSGKAPQMETLAVNGHRCRLERLIQRIHTDMVESPDPEKARLPTYSDKTTTSPYDDQEKRVGGNQHIYLPRNEADALMLTQDVLFNIQDSQRAASLLKIERQARMDALVLLILKILMALAVLALMLMMGSRVAFREGGE